MTDNDSGDFRERIRQNFARQAAMHTIGAELTRVEHGVVEIELPFDVKLTQQHGDLACGRHFRGARFRLRFCRLQRYRSRCLDPDDRIQGQPACRRGAANVSSSAARSPKPGSNIIVADGRAYAIGDGPAKLIASMTSTMMVIRGREGITG